MSVPSLIDMLSLLAIAGGLGPILSFLSERSAWFQQLSPTARLLVIFGLCVALPIVARVAIAFVPPNIWTILEPYWQSLALGFLAFLAATGYHLAKKATA